ncbi:GDSL-type esterase/lipase family protein [Solibacillus sp. FSL H8-0538]|uniref:GDSL-type esterase/lipase family protein n=1 Tax=Solibacillus sp. FSL H8-0538 TaxID=2921400 RepID=UPI0030F5B9B1
MKLYTIFFISCLLLFGCSITVDEPQAPTEKQLVGQEVTPSLLVDEETASVEEESSSIVQILETIFQLEWASKKSVDAKEVSYLALGDSLTRGIGDEKNKYGYTNRLVEQLEKWPNVKEINLDNRGKRGRRSDQLLALLEKGHYDEALANADLITITIGGNDVMKVVKSDLFDLKKEMFDKELISFQARYLKIFEAIRFRNPNVPIVAIGFYNPFSIIVDEVTPFKPIIHEWNMEIQKLAEADGNACFIPIEDLFDSNADMVYHTDFFHPNSNGYERMTERIVETMKTCKIEEMSAGLIGFEE